MVIICQSGNYAVNAAHVSSLELGPDEAGRWCIRAQSAYPSEQQRVWLVARLPAEDVAVARKLYRELAGGFGRDSVVDVQARIDQLIAAARQGKE